MNEGQKIPRKKLSRVFDFLADFKNYNLCPQKPGVYVLFHKQRSKTSCLYVGASVDLPKRATRFFGRIFYSTDNFYLKATLSMIDSRSILVGIKYFDEAELDQMEREYILKYAPMFNFQKAGYERTKRRTA